MVSPNATKSQSNGEERPHLLQKRTENEASSYLNEPNILLLVNALGFSSYFHCPDTERATFLTLFHHLSSFREIIHQLLTFRVFPEINTTCQQKCNYTSDGIRYVPTWFYGFGDSNELSPSKSLELPKERTSTLGSYLCTRVFY